MFKIIALETLKRINKEVPAGQAISLIPQENRYRSIMKVLKEEKRYKFYSDYDIEDGNIVERNVVNRVSDDFYSGDSTPSISVCSIVGENGSGKSSLIELYLRMINNVIYACRSYLEDLTNTKYHFVRSIFARLYMLADEQSLGIKDGKGKIFFIIEQEGDKLSVRYQKHKEWDWEYKYGEKPSIEDSRDRLRRFFYTEVINYSAYAYNSYDFTDEWNIEEIPGSNDLTDEQNCWLYPLFHKNDGYQAPMVLNPYRSQGNINYNNERELTLYRLYSLAIQDEKGLSEILNGKKPRSFIFKQRSDLIEHEGQFCSAKVKEIFSSAGIITYLQNGSDGFLKSEGNKIVSIWKLALNVNFKTNDAEKDSEYRQALNYLVYKTIKIALTYHNYFVYYRKIKNGQYEEYIKKLCTDGSHITAKLRRTIAFLVFRHYHLTEPSQELFFREYKKGMDDALNEASENASKRDKNKCTWKLSEDDLMPAPCFRTDMLLDSKEESLPSRIRFSTLSSGEKQMVFALATIIYHLRNIESVSEGTNSVAYKNVQLIFEEIELYYHPEYQRQLVNMLVKYISNMQLDSIKNVNILISSHSPFVLSDIPKSNVLFMKDGCPQPKMQENTFGANINGLLKNGFFLPTLPIGEFAYQKINKMFEKLHEGVFNKDELLKLRNDIMQVGEPYLRGQLLKLYKDYEVVVNNNHLMETINRIIDKKISEQNK